MLRLSRLVWRDAASRYWAGLIVAGVPGVYLWREWPPWVLRDALWDLPATTLLWMSALAAVIYAVLSSGPTRQLVASERLAFWRQQPIAPTAWRSFHGAHLLLLHAPALATLSYLVAPAGLAASLAIPGSIAVATLGPAAWHLGHPVAESRSWAIRLPHVSSRPVALARVLALALLRRRPAALAGMVAASVALAGLAWVATRHVMAAGELPNSAAWGFSAAAISVGATAVWTAWPRVRREQWWFDSMGADAGTQRMASVLLVAAAMSPAALLMIPTAVTLGPAGGMGSLVAIVGTAVWAGAIAMRLDADAVRRRQPTMRRSGRFMLALVIPIPLSAWNPGLLLIPCSLAWWSAKRAGEQATIVRRRFEIENVQDDHG